MPRSRVRRGLITIAVTLFILTAACGDDASDEPPLLRLATTTSLYDTGLWDLLEPMFEERAGVDLDVIYAGTGVALEHGRNGDVDVIAVHSRERELTYVAEGHGVERVPFACNSFLLVGPASDPAGVAGMSAEDAFVRLAESQTGQFVSRGDDSGTHGREKSIWSALGYDYDTVRTSGDWYVETGAGMGPTLVIAHEKQAYTLSDVGTFLSYLDDVELVALVEQGELLANAYSIIMGTGTDNQAAAEELVEFVTAPDIQEVIGEYGVADFGRALFDPCAGTPGL